jgi:hypothetical protein
MTAWIMVDSDGMPTTRNMYDLYKGFKELGEPTKTYNAADIFADTIPSTDDDIVVGHIDQCRRYIARLNKKGKTPPNLDYPKELHQFMYRDFTRTTLSRVYNEVIQGGLPPLFIKSINQKELTGFVCNNFGDYVEHCTGYDLQTPVFCCKAMDFISEYRTYIHRHQIVACLRYKGDYDKAPCKETVEAMLYALRDAKMPVAYSIDVGVLADGRTALVECNDGFALGNYGVGARVYAEMHRDRWYQMVEEMREE